MLTFVVHNGPADRELRDPDIRYHIRQKAMRNVALTRKKRGSKSANRSLDKTVKLAPKSDANRIDSVEDNTDELALEVPEQDGLNLRAVPVSSRIDSVAFFAEQNEDEEQVRAQQQIQLQTKSVSPYQSLNHTSLYESARNRYQVDITQLSLLTHFSISRGTVMALSKDPGRLKTLMSRSSWSYLEFVPQYYGTEECLTAATDCVLQKVKGVLINNGEEKSHEMELYSKALYALQTALCDKSKVDTSAVLCATQLLSLHELLSFDRKAAWSWHIRGTERLFTHRGPERCRSVFDQAMLAAHIGSATLEACFEARHCYLEDSAWMNLYKSFTTPVDGKNPWLSQFCPLAIDLRCHMILVPGIWCDVDAAVASPDFISDYDSESALATRCRDLHDAFHTWIDDYKVHCEKLKRRNLTLPQREIDMRRELFGMALECLVIIKRLFAAVCDEERSVLETEAAATARHIIHLQSEPMPNYWWLFSSAEMNIAGSILDTTEAWQGLAEFDSRVERQERVRACYSDWNSRLRFDELSMMTKSKLQ